jgi:uncharacterized UBP type Zn finger protein
MSKTICTHLDQIKDVHPKRTDVCEDCIKIGDEWVSLRMCLTCAHVGCCDNSKNKHATAHFQATGHPIIKSVTPGEEFVWCYVDKMYLK